MTESALTAENFKGALSVEFEELRHQLKEDIRLTLEQFVHSLPDSPHASNGSTPPVRSKLLSGQKSIVYEKPMDSKKSMVPEKNEAHSVAAMGERVAENGVKEIGQADDFALPGQPLNGIADPDADSSKAEPKNNSWARSRWKKAPARIRTGDMLAAFQSHAVSIASSSLQSSSRAASALKKTQQEAATEAQRAMGLVPGKSFVSDSEESFTSTTRRLMAQVVESPTFEFTTIMIILAYGIQVGFQTDYMARHMLEDTPTSYRVAEVVFLCLFSIELVMRIYVYRLRFFYKWGWGWNVFDFLTVLLQLVEEIILMVSSDAAETVEQYPAAPVLRVAKAFRAIRIVRVLRLMTLLSELRLLVTCIAHSMKTFYWVMVLIGLMIYIVGIYCTHTIRAHRLSPEHDAANAEVDENLEYWFGSVPRSILSIFQGLSGGIDWNDLVHPFFEDVSPITGIFFVIWLAFMLIAVMNVVTGTFVEQAISQAQHIKDLMRLEQAKAVFKSLDLDDSGCVGFDELEAQFANPDVHKYFSSIEVDESQALFLFKMLDVNGSGSIDFMEFLSGCHRLQGSAKTVDIMLIMRDTRETLDASKQVVQAVRALQQQLEEVFDDRSPSDQFDGGRWSS